MRIIDADILLDEIKNKMPVCSARGVFRAFIEEQPIAFDINNIIKEFKEKAIPVLDEDEHIIPESNIAEAYEVKMITLSDAIEILERGGIKTETKEIRDESIQKNIHETPDLTNVDIVEQLEDYVKLLEKKGISKTSRESKLMLEAGTYIRELSECKHRLLEVIENGRKFYENTCKEIREASVDEYVCGMCQYHGYDIVGSPLECPGFSSDDCFKLNNDLYYDIIYKKEKVNE